MKAIQNQPHFNAKKTYAAYNTLVSSGWIQKVKPGSSAVVVACGCVATPVAVLRNLLRHVF